MLSTMGPGGGWAVNALSRKVAGCYGAHRGGSQIWPVWLGKNPRGSREGVVIRWPVYWKACHWEF